MMEYVALAVSIVGIVGVILSGLVEHRKNVEPSRLNVTTRHRPVSQFYDQETAP